MSVTRLSYTLTVERGETAPGDGGRWGDRHQLFIHLSCKASLSRCSRKCLWLGFFGLVFNVFKFALLYLHDRENPKSAAVKPPHAGSSSVTGSLSQWCIWLGRVQAGTKRQGPWIRPPQNNKNGERRIYMDSDPREIPGPRHFISRHNPWCEYHLLAVYRKITFL